VKWNASKGLFALAYEILARRARKSLSGGYLVLQRRIAHFEEWASSHVYLDYFDQQ
jgi:hypothetical protein